MAAYGYRQPYHNPSSDIHLKPMYSVDNTSMHSGLSSGSEYKPLHQHALPDPELRRLELEDLKIKRRVRVLRFASRILATILSGATLAPLTMTLVKFFQTKDTYYTVDGVQRTAWANDTITWYTYLYFGVALISFLLNLGIMLAYCCGVKKANAASELSGTWQHIIDGVHILVWIASAAIYRYGKEPVDGKFRDMWGWTCSSKAQELQAVITNIDYDKYCTIQVRRAALLGGECSFAR